MTDPGYVIDVSIDYAATYLLARGLIATVFDMKRIARGLRSLWRWGSWA